MALMWFSTDFSSRTSERAMAALLLPFAISESTSSWRLVRALEARLATAQALDDGGVEDNEAHRRAVDGAHQRGDVGDGLAQQVGPAGGAKRRQRRQRPAVRVLAEKDDARGGARPGDRLRDREGVVLAVRVEADERDVGLLDGGEADSLGGIAGGADQVQARLGAEDRAQHVAQKAVSLHDEDADAGWLFHIVPLVYRRRQIRTYSGKH